MTRAFEVYTGKEIFNVQYFITSTRFSLKTVLTVCVKIQSSSSFRHRHPHASSLALVLSLKTTSTTARPPPYGDFSKKPMCFRESKRTMYDGMLTTRLPTLIWRCMANQNTGMVDALGQSQLEDLCRQTAFQEVFKTQTEDVIELHLGLIKHSNTDVAEHYPRRDVYSVFFIESEEFASSCRHTDLGQKRHTSRAKLQTCFADKPLRSILTHSQSVLFKWTPWRIVGLARVQRNFAASSLKLPSMNN